MGASDFTTWGTGENADKAFKEARDRVRQRCEINGELPSGIATKGGYKMVATCHSDEEALIYVENHIDTAVTKHGPAGCIKLTNNANRYLFFGWYPT